MSTAGPSGFRSPPGSRARWHEVRDLRWNGEQGTPEQVELLRDARLQGSWDLVRDVLLVLEGARLDAAATAAVVACLSSSERVVRAAASRTLLVSSPRLGAHREAVERAAEAEPPGPLRDELEKLRARLPRRAGPAGTAAPPE